MPLRPITYLKNLFTTGKKPSQSDYADVFDSLAHKDDIEAINSSVINTALSNYDTALKEVTEGTVNTLGDVLQILSGFNTSADVKALLDAAGGSPNWNSIVGRPSTRPVIWDEQVVSLVNVARTELDPSGNGGYHIHTAVANNYVNPQNNRWVITDIGFYNIGVNPWNGSSLTVVTVSCLRSITIAINIRTAIL